MATVSRRVNRSMVSGILLSLFLSGYSQAAFAVQKGVTENQAVQNELVAAVPGNFPPHYLVDAQGNMTGFAIDSIREIARQAGYHISFIQKDTWKEVDAALRSGEVDLIPNLGITKGRQARFDFSRPMEAFPVSIFVRTEADYISGVTDLFGREVAVVEYNIAAKILAKYPDIKLKTSVKPQEALFELLSGNVDAFAYPAPGVNRMIGLAGLDDRVKRVGRPLREIKRGIAVLKGNSVLLERLDKGLERYLASSAYKKIYSRWHGNPSEYWTAQRVLMAMASLLLVLFVGMLAWRYRSLLQINRELQSTIMEKEQAQDAVRRYEEQINLLMKSTTEAMYGIGPDGKCNFANESCVKALGFQGVEQMLGENMHALVHHSHRDGSPVPEEKSYINQAFLKGEGVHVDDAVIWRLDGEPLDVEYWFYPTFERGQLTGGIVSFIDISGRKQAEQQLRESEARLNKAQEIARLGSWELSLETDRLIWSDEVYRIFEIARHNAGITQGEFNRSIHIDDRAMVRQARFMSEETGKPQQVVYRILLPGNDIRHVKEICETLRDEQGVAVAQSGTVQDITDMVLAEEELKKHREHLQDLVDERTSELETARDEAVKATQAKSGFLASMSHELRTPLNSIIGFTGIVKDGSAGDVNEEQSRQLGMAYDSARHLLELINDILDLSRVEAGKLSVRIETVELHALLKELADLFRPQVSKKDLLFHLEQSNAPGTIRADAGMLRQVLVNLLGNAVKFTDQGSVTLQCLQDDEDVVFRVIDTGIGIRQEDLAHVFDLFEQSDNTDTRLHEGAGLGLAISRRFTGKMGGSLTVESTPGKGSSFVLRLPVTDSVSAPQPMLMSTLEALPANDANRRILVVDDEQEAQELLRSYLTKGGYEVVTCHSGNEALEMARKYKPLAITLDILMPDPDGWTTLARLKKDPETSPIPVIMVSIQNDKELSVSLGAVDYLQKPVHAGQLLDKIDNLRSCGDVDILVVDDEMRDASLMRTILQGENYRIHHAFDGAGAMEKIKNLKPDLVFLDLVMPHMNGFEVIRAMHDDPALTNIPVIVFSSKELQEGEKEYLRLNVREVMSKGHFTRKELLTKVDDTLSARRNSHNTQGNTARDLVTE